MGEGAYFYNGGILCSLHRSYADLLASMYILPPVFGGNKHITILVGIKHHYGDTVHHIFWCHYQI